MSKIPMCGTPARKEKKHPPKNSSPLSFSQAEQHCWMTHHPGNLPGVFLTIKLEHQRKRFSLSSFFLNLFKDSHSGREPEKSESKNAN